MDVVAVSHNYRRMAQSLAAEARAEEAAGHHLTARKLRYKAAMVFDAARQELTDPEPPGVLGPRPDGRRTSWAGVDEKMRALVEEALAWAETVPAPVRGLLAEIAP